MRDSNEDIIMYFVMMLCMLSCAMWLILIEFIL